MAGGGDRLGWRHRVSLRLRITVITSLVVAVAVALGGFLILLSLESELLGAADQAGKDRAQEIAGLAVAGTLPTPLPAMRDPETPAAVVSRGRVVSATPDVDEPGGLGLPESRPGQVEMIDVSRLPLDFPGPYRVAAQGVATPNGPMTVFVAVPVHDVEHTIDVATRIAVIGLSLLVAVLATVLWLAIGRALAPVNAIRTRADAISGQSLDLRVPTPVQYDEIGRLARTVNQMLERLQRSSERQRTFVADAAHELRSPIASLRVQLETARDNGWSDRPDPLGDMLHETARMHGLVDQLLLLARADTDTSWLRVSTVDLDDIVDAAVGSLARDSTVAVDTSAVEPVQLTGDAALLEQVARNLVQNAVTYARETVRVSLRTTDPTTATLIVDDDGPGVPPGRREDVFERFVRLDDSRDRDRGGVGLGLAIVLEIVNAHGGRIHVADSPLGGARFVVELPTTPAAPPTVEPEQTAEPTRQV
jgi:signal transduction histidine kinase